MLILQGKGVWDGVAAGPVKIYRPRAAVTVPHTVTDPAAEQKRFTEARRQAQTELAALGKKALAESGEKTAALFDVHQLMLDDPDYVENVKNLIAQEHLNAEAAVDQTAAKFAALFAAMDDAYMQARSADVQDISRRVIACLSGATDAPALTEPVLLAAHDLTPSATVALDKSKLLGFLTEAGSPNSHTAILARTMGIPAVVAVGACLDQLRDGQQLILDGAAGKIYVDPDAATRQKLLAKQQQEQKQQKLLADLKGKPNVTHSGRTVKIYANIGRPEEAAVALANDAGGIGLFRSEFLYLDKETFPTEEEQFQAYKKVLTGMQGREVVIRTLDIGADKQCAYFNLEHEANPALGLRAIRICLTRPEIFKTQLRAILRASAFGKALLMLPMITSVEEVEAAKKILHAVQAELSAAQIPFAKNIPLGIMIETPAAALISDELARHVDFFSVGTNDLTQYTLALDRQNPHLGQFFKPHHPALLKLIALAAKNAHAAGIWIGICGELGADPALTQQFLELGIDELSVAPAAILPLRQQVRNLA
ncbi:MAG: phosphoenolpyruvate--protein phosphotransferase [Acidaminococcaceae bacterium]|jgi:phosphotransferase system enzyme I (PtsI)|nr:phosphoenolpyruvate--protein phosphotransferase [Acidaminococcaceae bacterium]